jgi:predicted NodU family carbamoyl transferase/ferredoxin
LRVAAAMKWTASFAHVISPAEVPGRDQLAAHFDAVIDRSAETPRFAEDEKEPEAADRRAAWRAWLSRGELLAGLGLWPRESEFTLVQLGSGDLALESDVGAPLLVDARADALVANVALLDALRERALIVSGDAGELWRFSEGLGERRAQLRMVQGFVDVPPVLQLTGRLLHERYGCPIGELLAAPDGGWLAFSRRFGELLELTRPRVELYATGRSGDRIEAGQWGPLEIRADGKRRRVDAWACVRRGRSGELGVVLGVPNASLGSRVGPDIRNLHQAISALPVFAYRLALSRGGCRLSISPVPNIDLQQARAAIVEGLTGFGPVELDVHEAGLDLGGVRVTGHEHCIERVVRVVWSGPAGSDARRGAWRVALAGAASGFGPVRLVDVTGEPFTDPLAEQALAERREVASERAQGVTDGDLVVGFGRASAELAADGWIIELAAEQERDGMFVAGVDRVAVEAVAELFRSGVAAPELAEVLLNGVHMQPYSRPTLAWASGSSAHVPQFYIDTERCTGNGDCVRICPTKAITLVERRPVIDEAACIRCHLCNERCEQLALRPSFDGDAHVDGRTMIRDADRIAKARDRARPRALTGKLVEPPAGVEVREPGPGPAVIRRKPTVVLGLATVTLMEHAAALLVDGELVAAIEEERLARVRHYTFEHPERPGASLASDTCLRLEDAWPPRAIEAVLASAGLSMDDVDLVAINGIPARFRHSFAGGGGWRPPPVLRANSMVFVPHHMAHAASVYGLSGFNDAWLLSVDGRGDYETATVWRAEGHELEVVDAVPWLPDRSFGGVYETVTRVLGFGNHGQGSTMALAALGEPTIDFSDCMGIDADGVPVLSERVAEKRFAEYQRGYQGELSDDHKNLAASAQLALERSVGDYLARHAGDLRGQNLGICGGVALNCRMNGILRERFEPAQMHVPPGANDAGTAIGAALIGHRELTGELPRLDLGHTHLGPVWSDEAIARSLERMRVPFQRLREVGAQTAALLADGKIVCWFQGRMEFGPRALGGRSILADPRREDLKARLNLMKSRQSWRPFGPSVLAGRQREWFVHDWDSRFMLFAVDVKPDKREQIPVVVHFDGSSRPQVVHREHHPRYHDLISAFERRTGVPMVVNTSFNRGGEPIVCNPVEAMRSFAGLGADAIVLGDCLVRRELLRRR